MSHFLIVWLIIVFAVWLIRTQSKVTFILNEQNIPVAQSGDFPFSFIQKSFVENVTRLRFYRMTTNLLRAI